MITQELIHLFTYKISSPKLISMHLCWCLVFSMAGGNQRRGNSVLLFLSAWEVQWFSFFTTLPVVPRLCLLWAASYAWGTSYFETDP